MIFSTNKKSISFSVTTIICFIIFILPVFILHAEEATSTSFKVLNEGFGSGPQMDSTNFSVSGSLSRSRNVSYSSSQLPLVPGNITSCGKIIASGTYTLSANLTDISGTCFYVQANGVTINGAGYTVTALGGNTNYAVAATSSVVNGGSAYGTTTIQNIIFLGFGGGVNANANDASSGNTNGGTGGSVTVATSTLGNIASSGGVRSGTGTNGGGGIITVTNSTTGSISTNGTGGSIFLTSTNLNLSNNTYTANQTLSLNYSGTLTTTNTTLSALSNFIINTTNLGSYVGGTFPLIPGTISSCGSLYFGGVYTLGGNFSGNCNVLNSGITIAGAGNTLTGNITIGSNGLTLSNININGNASTTGAGAGALILNNASNILGIVSVTGSIGGDGSSSLGNTTISAGGSVATSSVSFVGDLVNNGTVNSGNSVVGKTINNATINGNFAFNASSTNSGTVNGNAILSASSTNTGTITGNATFGAYTGVSGAISLNGTTNFGGIGFVNGFVYDSNSSIITTWIFNASSTLTTNSRVKGDVIFNSTSINSGTINGNATFNDTSRNLGTVTGNSYVYSPVVRPLTGTTNGQVIYYNYAGLYFNDSVPGHGATGAWNDILNWWLDAATTVRSPVIPTAGDDVIILLGNITSGGPTSVNSITFQNNSTNNITITLSSTSTSASLFNASSTNGASGVIIGNATFFGPGTDNLGTVSGYITRQYGSSYEVVGDILNNFTYLTVQALNGAIVNLQSATYNFTNFFFQAFNNAIFILGNSLFSGTPNLVISSPVSGTNIKWAPVVLWGDATLCQYKIDGGNYTSVACANNGSDIPRPSAGSHIIFFKSTNLNNIIEKSVSFFYDNTQPIDTDCSSPLDEATRPYYYLNSNTGTCSIAVSTTLRGDNNGGGIYYIVGNITGSSTDVVLQNITAMGQVSGFNNINISSSTVSGTTTINGVLNTDNLTSFGNGVVESGGNITGGTFTGTLLNKSGGTISNSTTTPVTVASSTTNIGTITSGFIFNAASTNSGVVTGTTTLNDTSRNTGVINGNTILNGSALNSGTINGDLIFNTLTAVSNAITFSGNTTFGGTNIVSGNNKDNQGNNITFWIFRDNSSNNGMTKGEAFFNGTSTNLGTINGNAHFSDASLNTGTVTGSADFYSRSFLVNGAPPPVGTVNGSISYHSYPNAPSFKNISGDNNWSNLSNWFTFSTSTMVLGRTPIAGENIVLFASTTLVSNLTNNIFFAVSSSTLDGAGYTVSGNVSGNGAYGGEDAYNFNIQNITITGIITAIGGDGTPTVDGGNGGVITVATSSTGVISVNGGDPQHNGGDAGAIIVYNSFAIQNNTPLLSVGGDSTGCGFGGSGGNVFLYDSSGYFVFNGPGADSNSNCGNTIRVGASGQQGNQVIVGRYVSPAQRALEGAPAEKKQTTASRVLRDLINVIKPILFDPIPFFTPFGKDFKPGNSGVTKIPYPFYNFKPTFVLKLPFLPRVNNNFNLFLAPFPKMITDLFARVPKLQSVVESSGIKKSQDIASLIFNPVPLSGLDNNIFEGLFIVKLGEEKINIYLTYDKSLNSLAQIIKVSPDKIISVSVVYTGFNSVIATYLNQDILFSQESGIASAKILTPQQAGRYILKISSSPIPLIVEVVEPVKVIDQKTQPTILEKLINWFKKYFL